MAEELGVEELEVGELGVAGVPLSSISLVYVATIATCPFSLYLVLLPVGCFLGISNKNVDPLLPSLSTHIFPL